MSIIRHTGENQGIGIVPWDGVQTQRFRGSTPALQALDFVNSSEFLDDGTKAKLPKIAITNISRILGTPDARRHLGLDVKEGRLFLAEPKDQALKRLTLIVSDIAHKKIKVTDLDTKEQRIDYAKNIVEREKIERELSAITPEGIDNSHISSEKTKQKDVELISPDRSTLIPKAFKVAIKQTRINRIYHELRKLTLSKFVNCSAVMFRVFIELCIDDYAKRHRLTLKESISRRKGHELSKDMTLRKKLVFIAGYLEDRQLCSKDELRGVRSLISNRNHILSVDNLNAYVHNKDYSPTAGDLKINWDNLEPFIRTICIN